MTRQLAEADETPFADDAAFKAHLDRLGISALKVTPDPVRIATEGAPRGSVKAHDLLSGTAIVSDDAGRFNVAANTAYAGSTRNGLCTSSTPSPSTTASSRSVSAI